MEAATLVIDLFEETVSLNHGGQESKITRGMESLAHVG